MGISLYYPLYLSSPWRLRYLPVRPPFVDCLHGRHPDGYIRSPRNLAQEQVLHNHTLPEHLFRVHLDQSFMDFSEIWHCR